jgi:GT2 family glycosyltransferase
VSPSAHCSPTVSVVTPLFNCLGFTQEMVSSLLRSMPPGLSYEIILVDDGSTDGTREWLAGLGEPFRVLLNERNMGYAASTNRGAAAARGSILALLNNDLILQPGWIQPMLRALRSFGSGAGLVGNIQVNAATRQVDHAGIGVTLNGKPEHDRTQPRLPFRLFRPVRRAFAVTGACVLVRAAAWRHLGGFDEAYINGCEDVDLCLRAREAGLINAVALRSRVLHHVSSSPGRNLRNEENARRLVLRWRRELADEASRLWTWGQFCGVIRDPRDFPDTWEALRTALYLAHLWRKPPASALVAMNAAIEVELAHWREMFSD